MLQNKKILLGITGGIAAYKCAELVRLFIKEGAEVKVVMTKASEEFVTAKTLSVLSKNEVLVDFFDHDHNWHNHVELGEWADLFVIAPLTANTLAKMASGQSDNILLTTYLSARCPVVVAPAMDLEMYRHETVRKNLEILIQRGNLVIPAESGELASGLSGEGRMAEPGHITDFINKHFAKHLPLHGKKTLVNAGPTYEAIDPVRFIGNRSSGKMGVAIADALAEQGAEVLLILGPSVEKPLNKAVKTIRVESSEEMYARTVENFKGQDIVICSAAVADYKPEKVSDKKIKKSSKELDLKLVKTKDILAELGQLKTSQCLVGFALETDHLEEYAREKLKKKNLDIVVANSATEPGSGFSGDTNKVTVIDKHNKITKFELKAKQLIAKELVEYIIAYITK